MNDFTAVPIIWENSIKDFDSLPIKDFYSNVEQFTEQFHKEFPLKNIEVHIGQTSKQEREDRKHFVITLHLHFKNGKVYLSKAKNSNINLALREVIREIRSQTELSDKQKHFTVQS
jgi:hypothetical protein